MWQTSCALTLPLACPISCGVTEPSRHLPATVTVTDCLAAEIGMPTLAINAADTPNVHRQTNIEQVGCAVGLSLTYSVKA